MPPKRVVIQTPSGRSYSGRCPDDAAQEGERRLSALLGYRLSAARDSVVACEVPLFCCGRADIATPTDIFEVEPVTTWAQGLQQVLAYAYETGLRPNLAVFGRAGDVQHIYAKLYEALPGVELWSLGSYGWRSVRTMAGARVPLHIPAVSVAELRARFKAREEQWQADIGSAA